MTKCSSNWSEKGARATRDKVLLRRTLSASEVPQPRFVELENGADPTVVDLPFPVIVKPRSGSASRGVMSVTTASGLPLIVDRVENIARSLGDESILVEEYIDGREVAVEGIASADDVLVLAIFDKPDTPSGPTFEETLFVTPAELTTDLAGELTRLTTATVRSLGLSHGPFHAEFRIADDGRPVLIEIAARSIGGLCGRSLRFGIEGATLEELILLAALGRPFPAIRQPYASGVMMLPVPKSGILRGVEGLGPARSLPGVGDIEITIPAGTRVDSLPEGDRYLGFIFATGPSAAGVAMVLRQARAALTVTIDPA